MTGLYIHVPFCLKKCAYCDFYSLKYSFDTAEDYTKAVIRNLQRYPVKADTVYFGGGTPTLLSPTQIYRILDNTDRTPNAEVTMECNPKTADRQKFSDYKSAGVNRLSVGVQSLSDRELSALGRLHSAEDAKKCVFGAYSAGIENISADVMLGIPYQTAESLGKTLTELSGFPLSHVSAYMLKVEDGTPLSADVKLLDNISDSEQTADMYLLACDILRDAGYERYEISNFSLKGMECRHNLKYWKCEDYVGIGPAAHSCYNGKRYSVPNDLTAFIGDRYQKEVLSDDTPCGEDERIMLGLRLSEGICPDDYSRAEIIRERAEPLKNGGFLDEKNGRLFFTDKGALVSNEIIARITL